MTMISDEALMLEFQRGSREAFEELFARYPNEEEWNRAAYAGSRIDVTHFFNSASLRCALAYGVRNRMGERRFRHDCAGRHSLKLAPP